MKKVSAISEKDLILFDCRTLIKLVIVFKRVKYREMLRIYRRGRKEEEKEDKKVRKEQQERSNRWLVK